MTTPSTLSERFRSQRSDRIRVDETEVLSMVELVLEPDSSLEVIVESARKDVAQGLSLRTKTAVMSVRRSPDDAETSGDEIEIVDTEVQCVQLPGAPIRSEIEGPDDVEAIVKVWNTWRLGDSDHAWTGNCGIIVEELEAPAGAQWRKRLWCSDGLGDPSFDDLVVLLTIGERI